MNTEIWKPVVGHEGQYEVSSFGRVRSLERQTYVPNRWGSFSLRTTKSRVLRVQDNGKGYSVVHLCTGGLRTSKLAHRLVAEAFIPNPSNYGCVNHIDGDKTNNTRDNLEWCSHAGNTQHAHAAGLTDPHKVPVIGRCLRTGRETYYSRQIDAEIALSGTGRPSSAVHHCLIGRKKTAYGHTWRAA